MELKIKFNIPRNFADGLIFFFNLIIFVWNSDQYAYGM